MTLTSLLGWAWSVGIRVQPVVSKFGFAGAVWNVEDAPVITIAEPNRIEAFWLFDLGHEIGHVARGHLAAGAIIDVDSASPIGNIDPIELEATTFALDLLLPNHTELLALVRAESAGRYLRFKDAISTVARKANVSAGLLGLVAAYELSDIGQNKDRWGSATNLARSEGSGLAITQRHLRQHLRMPMVGTPENALIQAAILAD